MNARESIIGKEAFYLENNALVSSKVVSVRMEEGMQFATLESGAGFWVANLHFSMESLFGKLASDYRNYFVTANKNVGQVSA